jgi:uncharacterized protein (TIGR02680 family)
MTSRLTRSANGVLAHPQRFRLSRAGVLNVWQYDEQIFQFAGGRLLLRGANGAGKSKTLEMLLPFVLDGDKLRMTASGRHHTSLLWLMTDGYDGTGRTGYIWVEFTRPTDDGRLEWFTCGVGIRAAQSTRSVTTWHFTSPHRVGHDLLLEDETGPLSRDRCRAAVEGDGRFFDSPRQYKQHVGEALFGLTGGRYDELLRLLYWLRQPQVGEDIEPSRLAEILAVALAELDDSAVRSAGGTLDELAAFGEQLGRRRQAAEAMAGFAELYGEYARAVVVDRGSGLVQAHRDLARLDREVGKYAAELSTLEERIAANAAEQAAVEAVREAVRRRVTDLEASPEARSHHRVLELGRHAEELASQAKKIARHAVAARGTADSSRQRVDRDAELVIGDCRAAAAAGQSTISAGSKHGLRSRVAVPSILIDPALPGSEDELDSTLLSYADELEATRSMVGELQAAVRIVDESRQEAEEADRARRDAEREEMRTESAVEAERARLAEAEQAANATEQAFAAALAAWRADERAVPLVLPDELDRNTVRQLASLARDGAGPEIRRLVTAQADAASSRMSADQMLVELRERRAAIYAERDPAPAPPPLGRSERSADTGAPLWKLVDFGDGLDAGQRAGLEAALESSGLLDAWARVDGQVLDRDQRDVVLPCGPRVPGLSLADLLSVDRPAGCAVAAETVRYVLARISVSPDGTDSGAVVGPDGSWRLGPLTGRAAKPTAQYIGGTARAAERARRLAELDAQITAAEESRRVAAAAEDGAHTRRTSIEAWLDAVPPPDDLFTVWAAVEACAAVAARAVEAAQAAAAAAAQARVLAAATRRELKDLAQRHGLPTTEDGLAARREKLRELDAELAKQVEVAKQLRVRLARWREDLAGWADLDRQATELEAEAADVQRQADAAAERYAALHNAVEASIRELEERLDAARKEIQAAKDREAALRREESELNERRGGARRGLRYATEQRAAQEPVLVTAAQAVAALAEVPGLLDSAGAPADGAYGLARGVTPGVKTPPAVVDLARSLAALELSERLVTAATVLKRHTEMVSGPAADCEPRVLGETDPLAVVARDETGEYPLGELAGRLTAQVKRDAELLTERERRVFEEHILGDLGEALRARRLDAEELVAAMSGLLAGVTTSQGVQVSLHWRLRDEVPEDARQAVALLGRPIGALLPDERQALRDALHRLIEASHSEEPELSYTEHLARALDYRQWFSFRVRYTRPELDGRWLDLHRRSPLSQGEQKVVCYLPLFAAAAAHFSSVAGAAPHAPRFVLLDDAFPKIDVRTHPLLFGLLVDLDLDFLITSERLWGDHETVPALAIYEALRDPSERGIAQYEHRWDGQRLHSVGA